MNFEKRLEKADLSFKQAPKAEVPTFIDTDISNYKAGIFERRRLSKIQKSIRKIDP